jgi:hypothetical protein
MRFALKDITMSEKKMVVTEEKESEPVKTWSAECATHKIRPYEHLKDISKSLNSF